MDCQLYIHIYGSKVKIFVQRTYQYCSHETCDTYVLTGQVTVICRNSSLPQEAIPESSMKLSQWGGEAGGGWVATGDTETANGEFQEMIIK